MIEDQILQYGVLGIWTVVNLGTIKWFMKKDDQKDQQLRAVIENNTIVMTRVAERMQDCPVKRVIV